MRAASVAVMSILVLAGQLNIDADRVTAIAQSVQSVADQRDGQRIPSFDWLVGHGSREISISTPLHRGVTTTTSRSARRSGVSIRWRRRRSPASRVGNYPRRQIGRSVRERISNLALVVVLVTGLAAELTGSLQSPPGDAQRRGASRCPLVPSCRRTTGGVVSHLCRLAAVLSRQPQPNGTPCSYARCKRRLPANHSDLPNPPRRCCNTGSDRCRHRL